MPHKYEREIEEILRNMEQSEPRRGPGERIRSMPRPTSSAPRPRGRFGSRMRGTSLEVLMGTGILLALVAAGIAYTAGPGLLSGVLAIVAFSLFAFSCIANWMEHAQGSRAPRVWRGTPVDRAEPTPISMHHRGFFSEVATQLRILRLKWRYWRSREH
jgi:hypothetical protein